MYIKYHIIIGAIVSIILYLLFPITIIQAVIIFLASFLIDLDHFGPYYKETRNLNPKKATKYYIDSEKKWIKMNKHERKTYLHFLIIFHGFEFWIILLVLAFFFPIFYFILLGIAIHMVLDYIDMIKLKYPFYCKFSQVYVYLKNKKK
ncbi:MAG: metal-dependent hydrolase [archaeon]